MLQIMAWNDTSENYDIAISKKKKIIWDFILWNDGHSVTIAVCKEYTAVKTNG